jgi:hypothetical protein
MWEITIIWSGRDCGINSITRKYYGSFNSADKYCQDLLNKVRQRLPYSANIKYEIADIDVNHTREAWEDRQYA